MKTLDEAAKEYASSQWGDYPLKANERIITKEDFKSGVEFAQKWIPIEEELPENSMEVTKDGLHSYTDNIIYKTVNGKYGMTCRAKFLDHEFTWKGSGTLQDSITHWRPIELH